MDIGSLIAYGISGAAGAGSWLALVWFTDRREAWDSPLYFTWVLPILSLLCLLLSYFQPKKPWRWSLTMMAGQALVLFGQNPTGNLLPLGLIIFGVLSVPGMLTGWLGAFLNRRFKKTKLPAP